VIGSSEFLIRHITFLVVVVDVFGVVVVVVVVVVAAVVDGDKMASKLS